MSKKKAVFLGLSAGIVGVVCGLLIIIGGLWLAAGGVDNVDQRPSDLAKYPELARFFKACGTFKSGTANLDVGELRIRFQPSRTSEELYSKLDEIAKSEQWAVSKSSAGVRTYRKNLKRYPAQKRDDVVTVRFNEAENSVDFKWE